MVDCRRPKGHNEGERKAPPIRRRRKGPTMKKHGRCCKVCGEYRANEKFSGKGHAAHICKVCAQLPPEEQAERMTLNRLSDLPWRLSSAQKSWLGIERKTSAQRCGNWPGSSTKRDLGLEGAPESGRYPIQYQ